jgi:hypothetical protein
MSTTQEFEELADYAERYQLQPYDGRMHAWVFINADDLTIGEVAYAFYKSSMPTVAMWTNTDCVRFYKSLSEVPGDAFMVVYSVDFYFLKPYQSQSELI